MARRFMVGTEIAAVTGRASAGGATLVIDGETVEVQARRSPDGIWMLTTATGEQLQAQVSLVKDTFWVTVAGDTFVLTDVVESQSSQAMSGGLEAPMPGKVIAVEARVGQQVAAGDTLMIVEAMKMEHAIKSPHGGTVSAVHFGVGDAVEPGNPLCEVTPDADEATGDDA